MAIELKDLKALVQKKKLVIISVDERQIVVPNDEGSTDTITGYALTLAEPVTNLKSTTLTLGKAVVLPSTTEVNVIGDDVDKFLEDCIKDGDKVVYEGAMKLDVSRPKFRRNNSTGKTELVVGPRAFLVSVPFNIRGTQLRNQRTASVAEEMAKYLDGAVASLATDNTGVKTEQPKERKLEVTAEEGPAAGGKKI